MSWSDTMRFARVFAALALAGLTAGCFQPLYAEHPTAAGNASIVGQLRAVDVSPINAPGGSRLNRVTVNVRNELIYSLTGGSGGVSPTHRLDVKLTATQLQIIVDINTARPDINNYGIDGTYTLTELATGKVVVSRSNLRTGIVQYPGSGAALRGRARLARRRKPCRQGNRGQYPVAACVVFRSGFVKFAAAP